MMGVNWHEGAVVPVLLVGVAWGPAASTVEVVVGTKVWVAGGTRVGTTLVGVSAFTLTAGALAG